MNIPIPLTPFAGETWEIRLKEEPIGEFVVRTVDVKGNVIGDLKAIGEGSRGKLEATFGPLESALQGFAFAAAQEEESTLARRGLALHRGGITIKLGQDFVGLLVLFDEARFSFRLEYSRAGTF